MLAKRLRDGRGEVLSADLAGKLGWVCSFVVLRWTDYGVFYSISLECVESLA